MTTIYLVTLTTGSYSDTSWEVLRAFSRREGPDGADSFVESLQGLYKAALVRSDDLDDPFDIDGSKETAWSSWRHPLMPTVDVGWNDPRWGVEETELDGLWRRLLPGDDKP